MMGPFSVCTVSKPGPGAANESVATQSQDAIATKPRILRFARGGTFVRQEE
jgi:hypothetical protein